jgi:hypothetical protein
MRDMLAEPVFRREQKILWFARCTHHGYNLNTMIEECPGAGWFQFIETPFFSPNSRSLY